MKIQVFYRLISLIFLLLIFNFLSLIELKAHPVKKHKPMICILKEDRTIEQNRTCKVALFFHRLCKLDQDCAILKMEEQQKQISMLENKIKNEDPIACNSLTFSHVALEDASIFNDTSGNSKKINSVKKGQKVSYVGATDKEGWIIVVPKAKVCKIGYINESYIGLATSTGTGKKEAPKIKSNIEITYPKWKKVNELIVLDSSGFFEIDGFVNKDLGINKVIMNYDGNDEEMILGSDGSFNGSLQIENTLDVRITTFKNKKQIGKALVFKVEVE